jgi:3-hydroxyisobutyrate dehydrogenase-like beta-hydroxyacid dehydrogenase
MAAGMAFVDGGIVGGPAWESGDTCLYLSGEQADTVAGCFSGGPLQTDVLGEAIGKASALKMCYAAWTKGSTALLSAILATADAHDIWEKLRVQWDRDWPGFSERAVNRARRVTAKAWRFAGEMDEISSTFEAAGAPGEFHAGAAILYRSLAHFKDAPETPSLEEVLESITRAGRDRD